MDDLSKLQVLTVKQDNVDSQAIDTNEGWNDTIRASHVYEGSDDDSDAAKEWHTNPAPQPQVSKKIAREGEEPHYEFPQLKDRVGGMQEHGDITAGFQDYKLGQLANELEEFCPLPAMKKYPYTYVGAGNQKRVAEAFFDKNQLMDKNSWDLFYVHTKRPGTGYSDVIILVPTTQFEQFLDTINKELGTNLCIPPGASFDVSFGIQGMPHPRYLGRSTSNDMAERLKLNIPSNSYRRPGEPKNVKPTDRSLEAFRKKIELLQLAQKAKNKVKAEKKKTERVAERQAWSHSLKRVQRYLGLRETRVGPAPKKFQLSSDWAIPTMIDQLPPTSFAPDKFAPFPFEGDVVFISVDVEAYEKDHNKITEIGISTLDTRDLAEIYPGAGGINWRDGKELIRARHFRISDYKHLNNSEFIDGCADRFEFGKSEFISLAEAPSVVASCFKYPFSKLDAPAEENETKRNIILVGHDVMQDVNYLRKIGYDIYNLSNLMEQVDTASMWRYLTRDPNPRNLGSILADLGIIGWNLHNAGNDAAYTLQAMVGISIKAIVDKTKSREVLDAEKLKRVSAVAAEAQATALEREEEWGSNAESDGGRPIKPAPTPKVAPVASQPSKQISQLKRPIDKDNGPWGNGPWEHKPAVPGTKHWTQDDSAEKGGWRKPQGSKIVAAWDSPARVTAQTRGSAQKRETLAGYIPPHLRSVPGNQIKQEIKPETKQEPVQDVDGWGYPLPSQAPQNYNEPPPAVATAQTWDSAQVGGNSMLPPHLRAVAKQEIKPESQQEPVQEFDGWGYPIPSHATQSYNEVPTQPSVQGGNNILPPHLRSASGKQVKQEVKQEIQQEPMEDVDGWGYYVPKQAVKQAKQQPELEDDGWGSVPPPMPTPARAATPPVKQEHSEDLYEADSPRFEDEIPAGYSPGRRNNPIGEAIGSNPGSASNNLAGLSQNKQPLPYLARPAKSTTTPSGYRPSSGNPVSRMDEFGRLSQYFVPDDNEQAGVEVEFRDMNLDGKADGGHADAW